MPGLSDTLAELAARARTLAATPTAGDLTLVPDFEGNPGQLQMRLHLPESAAMGAPLVVVLHGCGQSAESYAAGAGWIELAERYGFALLCPEQTRANNVNLCFNWFEPGDIGRDRGEAASIAHMVRFAVAQYGLDAERVFITGLSAGGAMTAVLLATYPELFAAGAVIAGLPFGAAAGVKDALLAMRQPPTLSPAAWGDKVRAAAPSPPCWPRISIWHGDADRTVTPAAAEALAQQWCDVHGVSKPAHQLTGDDRHALRTWRGADGQVAVELHRLAGLAHGVAIATGGEDGCGSAGPWIIEAGVSSSLQIARAWRIADVRLSCPERSPQAQARGRTSAPLHSAPLHAAPLAMDLGETIASALKSAGLMR